MAEKIKKSIPWLVFIVLAGLIVGVGLYSFLPPRVPGVKAGDAATSTVLPQVEVANATPSVSVELILPTALTENTTTTATCTATITDTDGGSDVAQATATIYRSQGAVIDETCTKNYNRCYSTSSLSATSVAGDNYYATFTVDIWFHAEPGEWNCYVITEDNQAAVGTSTDSTPPEMATTSALIVESSINYQTLGPGATSSASQQTQATTTGNAAIDIKLKGTNDFSSNGNSFEADQQEYSTSEVDYGSGTELATTSYATLELASLKPELHNPIQSTATDIVYWRIGIPADQAPGSYVGTTSAAAVLD